MKSGREVLNKSWSVMALGLWRKTKSTEAADAAATTNESARIMTLNLIMDKFYEREDFGTVKRGWRGAGTPQTLQYRDIIDWRLILIIRPSTPSSKMPL